MKYFIFNRCFEKRGFYVTEGTFNELVDTYSFYYTIWRLSLIRNDELIVMYCALIGDQIHQIGFTVTEIA